MSKNGHLKVLVVAHCESENRYSDRLFGGKSMMKRKKGIHFSSGGSKRSDMASINRKFSASDIVCGSGTVKNALLSHAPLFHLR